MTYIVVQFDYPNRSGMYEKLLCAFEQSVKENDVENDIVIKRVTPPNVRRKHCFASNTHKLGIWVEEMEKLPEGHEICFIDCDMMVLKSPNDVFEKDFDIAYTERPNSRKDKRLPVNGGVVFCRNNERSRNFMKRWKEVNDKMYKNESFHQVWRKKYAGMNQSAFGYLLEHKKEYDATLMPVQCNTYNVCNESWHRVGTDEDMRIVHIKSDLRKMCLSGICQKPQIKKAIELWHGFLKRGGGEDIKLKITAFDSPTRTKRQPVPAKKKNVVKFKRKNKVVDLGNQDETIHNAVRCKNKRRLHIP